MLKALEIENFKCFGERVRIPMAPITLIYGPNSSGKSSILQALTLLTSSVKNKDVYLAFPPEAGVDVCDLGSFWDTVADHDLSKKIEVAADYELPDCAGGFSMSVVYANSCLHSLNIAKDDEEWSLANFCHHLYEVLFNLRRKVSIGADQVVAARFIQEIHRDKDFLTAPAHGEDTAVRALRNNLVEGTSDFDARYVISPIPEEVRRSDSWKNAERALCLTGIHEFYGNTFTEKEFIKARIVSQAARSILRFEEAPKKPQLELLDWEVAENHLDDFGCGVVAARYVRDLPGIASVSPTLLSTFQSLVAKYFLIKGIRANPQRSAETKEVAPENVGAHGEKLQSCLLHNMNAVIAVNGWLNKWQMGYRIHVDNDSVRITDRQRHAEPQISLVDVGFGLSQVLPILVQPFMRDNQLLAIQQPEEHLHPRMQADLASFFADEVKKHGHQFVIETHSENLMLRVQKLIRKGELSANEVSVLYVSRDADGSHIRPLGLSRQGEFETEWPDGFFEESFKEIFGG